MRNSEYMGVFAGTLVGKYTTKKPVKENNKNLNGHQMKESVIQQYKNVSLEDIVQQLYYEKPETQQILAKEMGKSLPVSLKKLTYLQRLELAKEIVAYFENENKQIVSTNQTSAIEQQSVSKIQEQIIVQLYTLQVMKDKILHQESKQICQQQIQFLRSLLQTMEG